MNSIAEKDWKLLRSMKEEKLNHACGEILQQISKEIEFEGNERHNSYLKVWKILNSEDRKICEMFDDLKRSNAILKLVSWKQNGLLTEQEISKFSEQTRSVIEAMESF